MKARFSQASVILSTELGGGCGQRGLFRGGVDARSGGVCGDVWVRGGVVGV